jgi:hypothetical protein
MLIVPNFILKKAVQGAWIYCSLEWAGVLVSVGRSQVYYCLDLSSTR